MQKIHQLAFALAAAILGGLATLVFATWNALTGFGEHLAALWVSVHPTVFEKVEREGLARLLANLDWVLLNMAYGAIDGFIAGWLLAFLYNWLAGRLGRKDAPGTTAP